MISLQHQWHQYWQVLQAQGDATPILHELLRAYQEPQRHYHTLQHLEECLSLLDEYAPQTPDTAMVGMALWFHDAIYDVRGHENEHLSADWSNRVLHAAQVAASTIAEIETLIMVTAHAQLPQTPLEHLITDIDLSILGATPERFDEYEVQIRLEYAWVEPDLFQQKRRAILASFLARPRLYHTPALYARLETQARHNLTQTLASTYTS